MTSISELLEAEVFHIKNYLNYSPLTPTTLAPEGTLGKHLLPFQYCLLSCSHLYEWERGREKRKGWQEVGEEKGERERERERMNANVILQNFLGTFL